MPPSVAPRVFDVSIQIDLFPFWFFCFAAVEQDRSELQQENAEVGGRVRLRAQSRLWWAVTGLTRLLRAVLWSGVVCCGVVWSGVVWCAVGVRAATGLTRLLVACA